MVVVGVKVDGAVGVDGRVDIVADIDVDDFEGTGTFTGECFAIEGLLSEAVFSEV